MATFITKRSTGFIVALFGAIFWGTYGTFTTLLQQCGLTAETISMIGPGALMICFTIVALRKGIGVFKIPSKMIPVMLLYGIFCSCDSYCMVKAYSYLPMAVVGTIIYCNLFLLIIFSRILFGNKLTKEKIIACCLAVLGIAMVVNIFSAGGQPLHLIGFVFAVGAVFSWAGLVLAEKVMLNAHVDEDVILSLHGVMCVIFLSILNPPTEFIANIGEAYAVSGGKLILCILGFMLLTECISYFLYISALKVLEPAMVQIAWTMDPVTACILGFLIFGQTLVPVQIAGIILILAVVIWLQLPKKIPKETT